MSDAIQSAILAAFSAALERAISQAVATHVQDLQRRLDDLADRTAELENNPAQGVDIQAAPAADITRHIIDALSDTDHPLFKRMSSFMDAVAEQAVENHCQTYDHDEYDGHIGDDDKHFDGDINDAINDALSNASISISV